MTIIGYIADKKDFGKKDNDRIIKKDKKKKNKKEEENVDIGQELLAENNDEFVDAEQPEVLPTSENIIDSFEMPTDLNSVDDQFTNPIEQNSIDTVSNEGLTEVQPEELPSEEQMVEQPIISEDNSNVEVQPVEEQNVEDSTEERVSIDDWNTTNQDEEIKAAEQSDMELNTDTSSEDFKLPNIENLDEQLMENSDDEDVWKF